MTPIERYQQDLDSKLLLPDPAQHQAVLQLQELYDRLVVTGTARQPSLISRFFKSDQLEPERGIYFWGGVGRGKTYLMDAFYDSLPFPDKMRVHFHRFMQKVHLELKSQQGVKNPLQAIAKKIKAEARVICFDEFFVSDIADAMILGGLMKELFAESVTLVATSNIIPDNLYKDGLQRKQFLPAIDLLNKHTKVVNVDGGIDYRLRVLERAEIYHSPLDKMADASLLDSFTQLAPDAKSIFIGAKIDIAGRRLKTVRSGDDVVWFTFSELCDGPRSQNDYIEIARLYHAVLISNVPIMGEKTDDLARRFVNLVDEFYDSNVKLIISAEAPIESLYAGGKLAFEFERTRSRLLEMQSQEYLGRAHKA
jgi:cell division protein ZapE